MITVKVIDNADGYDIKITGHANYAPHGQDIICSAVSAITQTALLGLEQIANQYPENVDFKYIEEDDNL